MKAIKNALKNLISHKYYDTRDEAEEKVSILWGMNRLTDDEFDELNKLLDEYYPKPQEETPTK